MLKLPKFVNNNFWIFFGLLIPLVLFINLLLFGSRYFFDVKVSLAASLITMSVLGVSWQIHAWVARTLRRRFSKDNELFGRVGFGALVFVLLSAITITSLFYGYDFIGFRGYELDEVMYNWALVIGIIFNIFLTIVLEIAYGFEKWQETLSETEQLKKEYMQSQLIGLRSQVSPHFLFNSLNSLSSLIYEDPEKAEEFLNEMSKVYRYLLRNNEGQTVTLDTELMFLQSYYHLLKVRYGSGVDLQMVVEEKDREKLLPPLTLQILLDNILRLNLISKEKPLKIDLYVNDSGWMEIRHNVQKRISEEELPDDLGITNISNKFRLLFQHTIEIKETDKYRVFTVPLMNPETVAVI
jgi:sensor histidine kinase YesM